MHMWYVFARVYYIFSISEWWVLKFSVQHLSTALLILPWKDTQRKSKFLQCPDFVLPNLSIFWASIDNSHANTRKKKDAEICCSLNHISSRCLQKSLILPFVIDIKLLLNSLTITNVFLYNHVFNTLTYLYLYASTQI